MNSVLMTLISPACVALALLLGSLIGRRRSPCVAAALLLYLATSPWSSRLLMRSVEGWRSRPTMTSTVSSQAVVVLGTGVRSVGSNSVELEHDDLDRFLAGVDLIRSGNAPLLVLTGAFDPARPDLPSVGEALRPRAVMMGIPEGKILVTGLAASTSEEAAAVRRSLGVLHGTSPRITLVTSAYHMQRAAQAFRRIGFEVVEFPADLQEEPTWNFRFRDLLPNGRSLAQTDLAMRELTARLRDWMFAGGEASNPS